MQLVPDPLRARPGRRGWTSTGLHRPRVPEAWQLQGGAGAAGSLTLGPLWPGSLSPFCGLPLPRPIPCRQRKPPTFPHSLRCQMGKVGLIFRFLYCGLTLPHIKNSSHCPGRPLCSLEGLSAHSVLHWVHQLSPFHPETFL